MFNAKITAVAHHVPKKVVTNFDLEKSLDFILRCDGSGGQHLYMPGGGSRHPATHKTVDRKMHFVHQDCEDRAGLRMRCRRC